MYKLTFTLKQHTPLIHFQPDQDGATLRASEVKPKLDKFLINILGGKEFVEQRKPNWLRNGALNYAMNIRTSELYSYPIEVPKIGNNGIIERDSNGIIKKEIFPCFFGNMGTEDSAEKKLFVFTNNPIKINITSNNKSILDFLSSSDVQKLISKFFNKNNFSSRQTKGFGSFSTLINDNEIDWEESKFYFDVNINRVGVNRLRRDHDIRFADIKASNEQLVIIDQWKQLFHSINLFHKVIKSGYNQQGGYVKSTLFKYFKDVHGIQWDKKSIKEKYFNNVMFNQTNYHNNEDILTYDDNLKTRKLSPQNNLFLVRDLLGLTSEADWKGNLYHNAKISKYNDDIERFMSPITYKPIFFSDADGDYYRVFIFLNEIPDEFLGETFLVQVNGTGNLKLDTPDRNLFSLSSYFKYLSSSKFDIDDLIKNENRDTIKIQEMFNCLKPE